MNTMENKFYFYEANCRIYLKAQSEDMAEKKITNINLNDFIIDEDLYETDEHHIPVDLSKREEKIHTTLHPLDDAEQYERLRTRATIFGEIFQLFIEEKIDLDQMIDRVAEAERTEVYFSDAHYEVQFIDLETKQGKTSRLINVP